MNGIAFRVETLPGASGPGAADVLAGAAGLAAVRLVHSRSPLWIGRARACDVCLPDPRVSNRHLEVRREARDWFLIDLGSTNGARHDGRRISPNAPRLLRSGDVIDVAGYRIVVELDVPTDEQTESTTALVGGRLVRRILGRLYDDAGAPRLQVVAGPDLGCGVTLATLGQTVRIGRAESCELRLVDALVSREHAAVRRDLAGLVVRDLGGTNGTRLRGEAIVGESRLRDRDELRVGDTRIVVSDPADAAVAALELVPDESWDLRGSALQEVAASAPELHRDAPLAPSDEEPSYSPSSAPIHGPPSAEAVSPVVSTPAPPKAFPWSAVILVVAAGAVAGASYLLYALLRG